MKRNTTFLDYILPKLAHQSGEEKLRIAFKLSAFTRKLREEGNGYTKKQLKSGMS